VTRKIVQAGESLAAKPSEVVEATGAVVVRPGVKHFEDGKVTRRFKTATRSLLDRRAALYRQLAK
jgi:hypothetical protein